MRIDIGEQCAVRVPLLPINLAEEIFDARDLAETVLRLLGGYAGTALYVASPTLFEELHRSGGASVKAVQKAAVYFLRMCFRPTPLGLCSGVGVVNFGETLSAKLDSNNRRAVIEYDSDFLESLSKRGIDAALTSGALRVRLSNLLVERGNRLHLVDDAEGTRLGDRSITIGEPVRRLLLHLNDPVTSKTIEALQAALATELGMPPRTIGTFLETLLTSGFLVSEYEASPTDRPRERLLQLLRRDLAHVGEAMQDAVRIMNELSQRPLLELSPSDLRQLRGPIDVDDAFSGDRIETTMITPIIGTLGTSVKSDLTDYAKWSLRSSIAYDLSAMHERFSNVFEGADRLVPLLEVVDALRDIGAEQLSADAGKPSAQARSAALASIAAEATRDHKIQRDLSHSEMESLFPENDGIDPVESFEIGFQILAENVAAVDRGDYQLAPSNFRFSQPARSSMARFAHELGLGLSDDLRKTDGALEVELVHRATKSRMNNVLDRPAAVDHELRISVFDASSRASIDPSDVFVGIGHNRCFFLYSRSLNRRLAVRSTNVLNVNAVASPVARVASLIANDGIAMPGPLLWGALGDLPMLPRLVYGRLIFSLARWTMRPGKHQNDLRTFAEWLAENRAAWFIPRFVSLVARDNKLIFDLDSANGIGLLFSQLPKRIDSFVLEEAIPTPDRSWLGTLEPDESPYVAEFVASGYVSVDERPTETACLTPATNIERKQTPNSDWCYLELYAPTTRFDTILRTRVKELFAGVPESSNAFFVRYAVPHPHLRIRVKVGGDEELRTRCEEFADKLVSGNVIDKFSIVTYEREIERYGGREALDAIEEIFAVSSRWALNSLRASQDIWDRARLGLQQLYALSTYLLDTEQLTRFIEMTRPGPLDRKIGTELREAVKQLRVADEGRDDHEALSRIAGTLRSLAVEGRWHRQASEIFRVIVHMHCNRLGISGPLERELTTSLWRALYGNSVRTNER
jgi:thiopeptide-type bacteriocin biosynthesis protein